MLHLSFQRSSLSGDGSNFLEIPKEVTAQTTAGGNYSLVGKLLDSRPNIDVVQRWVKTTWNLKGQVYVIEMLNGYILFKFSCEKDMKNVLTRGH